MSALVTPPKVASLLSAADLSTWPTSNPGGGKPWLYNGLFTVGDEPTLGLGEDDVNALIDAGIDNWVGAAPGALDTLVELAAALGDDANFATTITNALAGKQPLSSSLTDIAGLAPTDSNIIVGNGTTWVAESGATARTSLGLGTGDSPTFAGVVSNSFGLSVTSPPYYEMYLSSSQFTWYPNANNASLSNSAQGLGLGSGQYLNWATSAAASTVLGTAIYCDSQGILAQRNGTSAQTLRVYATNLASNESYLQISTSTTAQTIACVGNGTNANADLVLTPAGTGNIKFGTHSAIGAETVTGYITIKDSGGTSRKIAVVS